MLLSHVLPKVYLNFTQASITAPIYRRTFYTTVHKGKFVKAGPMLVPAYSFSRLLLCPVAQCRDDTLLATLIPQGYEVADIVRADKHLTTLFAEIRKGWQPCALVPA